MKKLPFKCKVCKSRLFWQDSEPPKESHIICKVVVMELRKKIMKHRTIREEV